MAEDQSRQLYEIKDTDIVIVDAVRTPIGQFLKSFRDLSAA